MSKLLSKLVRLVLSCSFRTGLDVSGQTCEHLRSVVDSSPELQYRIALYRHGMQDAPSKTPLTDTLSERHAKLIQYVFDRDAAQWGSETRLERHCNDLWSHQQGYFVSYSAPARTFTIDRIPSKARGIKAKEWSKHFGFPRRHVMGFTFDPSQHVLLVVTSSGIARRVHHVLSTKTILNAV